MNEYERAMTSYECVLRHNPYSVTAMIQIGNILQANEQYQRAAEFFQSVLNVDQENGEIWSSLGHCYLMMDDLQKTYTVYQQALYHMQNAKDARLWYGIGVFYERYGSLEYAEEAFSHTIQMDPFFEKANEIYFRLGVIYRQQHKYAQSLECFRYILQNPPKPLTKTEVWFQIGQVYEQQKEYKMAKDVYEHILSENPEHAKVLQQLGWLCHQPNTSFTNQDHAVQYLTKSLEIDSHDVQTWYFLGRCYMAQQKYNKAYEAYQQAVYRDGRNPTFWCSIGVLYYQINQFRDALDAYSRAIRLNPYISEVWYDLGTLYESCNNQIGDALNAYQRAAELDPNNPHIKSRLQYLRNGKASGSHHTSALPHPQDINPSNCQNSNLPAEILAQWSKSPHSSAHVSSVANDDMGKLPLLRPRSNEIDSPLPAQISDVSKKSFMSVTSNERHGQHTLSPTSYHHIHSNPYDHERPNHPNHSHHTPVYPPQPSLESHNGSHPVYHLACPGNVTEESSHTSIHSNTFNTNHDMKHLMNNPPNSHLSYTNHSKSSKQSLESIIHHDTKEAWETTKRQREWDEKNEVYEQKKTSSLKIGTKETSYEKTSEKKESYTHSSFSRKVSKESLKVKELESKELPKSSKYGSSGTQKNSSSTFSSISPVSKSLESLETDNSNQLINNSTKNNTEFAKSNNITEVPNNGNIDVDGIKDPISKNEWSGSENTQKIELTVRKININENYDNDDE
ncbi:hypothetical protein T552_01754 [Pneumocystis carinii B80]|uniref:Uncharacterized protein n=1 Tax=Pneumocystis carinii (strain B80) TaxID=1408658 RepID=A0A0W4ZJF3_PNEC8|nr:hypothetical protein T552_01754 [Pneumocystis carinii B80]KTW28494.1 hypothetical protein T552_01754 [Pneumocystis carinii B80]